MTRHLVSQRHRNRGQAGFTLIETLVAIAISVIVVGPVGAWMMLIFTTQAPTAAGFTDAGQSRVLNTWITRDVSSAEIVVAADPAPPEGSLITCAGTPQGATTVLTLHDLGSRKGAIVYGNVASPSGDTVSLFRWKCDYTTEHVVFEETEILRGADDVTATCDDDPDECRTVTVAAKLEGGHETSVTASRRSSAASLVGFGGTVVPVPYIVENSRTSRAPGAPITVDLVASAFDSDTPAGGLQYSWSVSGPGAASLSDTSGTTTTFSTFIAGDYTIDLEVFDGLNTATLPYSISVVNVAPIIEAASCDVISSVARTYNCTATAADADTDGPLGYGWTFPADAFGSVSTATGPNVDIALDSSLQGAVIVELRVIDDEGSSTTRTFQLDLGSDPDAPINVVPSPVNVPGHLPRLLSTDGDAASTRTATFSTSAADTSGWELIDASGTTVSFGPSNEVTHVFAKDSTGDFTIRRLRGAQPAEEVRFRVNSAPTVAFSHSVPQGNAPQAVTFTDLSSDDYGLSALAWDFSALGPFSGQWTGSGAAVSHTFNNPGTYAVQLTVTDIDGLVRSTMVPIEIPGVPAVPPPPRWESGSVVFDPVPGATGYVVTLVYGDCGQPVSRPVGASGPFRVTPAPEPGCTGGITAALAVRANAATGVSSAAVAGP